MNTVIKIEKFGGNQPETLTEFAKKNGLTLTVRERGGDRGRLLQYFAYFSNVEVMRRGMLASLSGDGNTPDEAAADYARQLAGKRIAVDAYTPKRVEIDVPNDFRHEPST